MRMLLFGDTAGVRQLLRQVPAENIAGIVGAAIRPQYHEASHEIACCLGVPYLIQPRWGTDDYTSFVRDVARIRPDLIWVNSYSMIVRPDVLALPRLGGLNLHGGLLPRYRGSNPTQWAILNGETETGVTLHEMADGLDTGAIIDRRVVPLLFEDTWQVVYSRIAEATDELIASHLPSILSGQWTATPQDENQARHWPRRTPADGVFDWDEPVVTIYNKVRALLPPLPASFYLDASGQEVAIDRPLSVSDVVALKYGPVGSRALRMSGVHLRPLGLQDASLLHEWIDHREEALVSAPFHPAATSGASAWLESLLLSRIDFVPFVIEDEASLRPLGTCQLVNVNWRHRSAELQVRFSGARCDREFKVTEVVQLLCRFAFDDLKLHRIYSHSLHDNVDFRQELASCGFTEDGLLLEAALVDGRWENVVTLGIVNANG